ncbi:MAG: mannose-1-phosphate guanylyltransferase/mannose-6-phosphate isomerase [Methylobacteriaceae bacterium]|nr:mannose-1-phosphate guanylyltransferase/mannose-6-phosphate isomerase [Methylobacteriaceae bacterium]
MPGIVPVIMCGGSGTRVWPESRESLPKQFIPLIGARSTFQMIVEILNDPAVFTAPIIITNKEYRFRVAEQLDELGLAAEIVLEPARRDSGPAVAVAAELVARRSPEAVVAILAADHVIGARERFIALCKLAAEAASDGAIVTFGIKPTHPATGFGYIRPAAKLPGSSGALKVEAFVEKPDAETAQRYIAEGCLWNSGNFVFRADVMREEIARLAPAIARAAQAAVAGAKPDLAFLVLDHAAFEAAPKISIDYAVMEKTARAAVILADIGWSDIGSWRAVWEMSPRDANGNSIFGHGVIMDAHNVHVRSPESLTAIVGVDDVIVVATLDAVLVIGTNHADKVKQLVDRLKAERRSEATDHKRSYRPWGHYQSIDIAPRHQVKRIVVKPAGRLSLQKHHHRAEHWVVVKGTAEVTRDGEVHIVHENESIYLPIGCTHRLANPGKIDLEVIEVQTGSYLGEDDIIRIDDVYNRS